MAIINHAKREINAKIVYYGLDGAGKITSLRYAHSRIKPELRGEFKIQPTAGSELVFFDFSPFERPVIEGYRLCFHIYTLHGKVANPAAWKMTLKGADGLVVVVVASPDELAATRQGLMQMRDFMNAYGVGPHDIPIVLQINKADMSGQIAEPALLSELGLAENKTFPTTATKGEGVLEALAAISLMVLERIREHGDFQRVEATTGGIGTGSEGKVAQPAGNADIMEPLSVEEQAASRVCDEKPLCANQVDVEGVYVNVAEEGVHVEGADIRIPLEIVQAGEIRRLLLTVTVAPR